MFKVSEYRKTRSGSFRETLSLQLSVILPGKTGIRWTTCDTLYVPLSGEKTCYKSHISNYFKQQFAFPPLASGMCSVMLKETAVPQRKLLSSAVIILNTQALCWFKAVWAPDRSGKRNWRSLYSLCNTVSLTKQDALLVCFNLVKVSTN